MIPGGDIAGVAAILSVSLGVIVKMPVANRAGHINRGAPDNLVAMCRPVFCAAFIRAEPPGFKAAIRERLTALRTESTARFLLYVVGAGGVPVAKGLHSGLGQANFIGDLRKALTGLPQLYDLLPLSVVHRNTSVVVVYTFLFGHRQRQCGHPKPKKSNEQSNSALCSLLFRNIIYCSHVDCGQRATSASILYAASNLNLVVTFVFSHEYLTWNIHFPALSDYIGCPS